MNKGDAIMLVGLILWASGFTLAMMVLILETCYGGRW